MTSVLVRHEAGPQFDTFAERLEALANETLPLVYAVTGLPLPDPVVIRTMTVRRWKGEHRRSVKRRLLAEAEELDAPLRDLRQAGIMRARRLKTMNRFWPTIGGQAVEFAPGHPELVFLAEALRHGGRLEDTPFLYKALGHEISHLAQYAASDGAVWAAQDTFFPKLRRTADRDHAFLLEGHAYWADQQITAKILGAPVSTDEASPHASARFRKLFATPQRKTTVEHFRKASDAVAQIIDTRGIDVFNRVWTTPDLVPTYEETVGERTSWQARFGSPRPQ